MSLFTIKKTAFALSLCLSITSLSYSDEMESRISSLEARMGATKTRTAKGTVGAKMATARPLTDGYGFFGAAELLFWHLQESGTDYVLNDKSTIINSPFFDGPPVVFPGFVKGESKKVHLDWNFGFRVAAGYLFEHDEWDTRLSFASFHTDGNRKTRAKTVADVTGLPGTVAGVGLLFPQFGQSTLGSTVPLAPPIYNSQTRMHWKVNYNVLDLQLGRNYFVSKFLAVRPLFGLETAWIDQDATLRARLLPSLASFELSFPQHHFVVKDKNDFWGIGPQMGVDTTWYFGRHFSFVGNIRGSLLWGDFDVTEKEKFTGPSGFKLSKTKGNFDAIVPNLKTLLALQWDMNFNDDCNHIAIELGYEFQYWWNQNQILDVASTLPYYMKRQGVGLSINGANLEVRIDF